MAKKKKTRIEKEEEFNEFLYSITYYTANGVKSKERLMKDKSPDPEGDRAGV